MKLRTLPSRLVTGAHILHSGMDKWSGSPEQAIGIHAMASNAFTVVKSLEAPKFLRALAAAEITTGLVLLTPFVPGRYCGCRADRLLRHPGSDVPAYPLAAQIGQHLASPQGTAVSKDIWMLGIGLGLLIDEAGQRRRSSRAA